MEKKLSFNKELTQWIRSETADNFYRLNDGLIVIKCNDTMNSRFYMYHANLTVHHTIFFDFFQILKMMINIELFTFENEPLIHLFRTILA